ncbi:MAG TPA: cytochrome oxidase small assembly protein [Burkholderiales bacterium]|nr:cytochrome oxidase small assembly protein [Burkholderiales bacterium]
MTPDSGQRASIRRTAWVLGSIALAFFLGIMLKYVLLK